MTKTETPAPSERAVIAKLRAAKDAASAEIESFVLKSSGVTVAIPKFRAYGPWAKAAQMAGKNIAAMNTIYITMVATFDGERLTIGDYQELIPAPDHIQISARLFGADEDAEGN